MGFFSKAFLRGTLTLLPLILTIYPLYYFFNWLDAIGNRLLRYFITDFGNFPGTGVVLGVITIFLLGILMSSSFVQRLYRLLEMPLQNIPLVKSLYSAIKELTRYLGPGEDGKKADKVVVITVPDTDVQLIGFVTRSDLSSLPDELDKEDRVAVYIPMSYQVGGFTAFLPRSWLTVSRMSVESAMKDVLTGWVSNG